MTIQSMIELFELVQDHYNTPYFPEEEITMFLNAGQKKIFNNLVFNGDSQVEPDVVQGIRYSGKFEMDVEKQNILSNCIVLDASIAAVGGVITRSAIETATNRIPALITSVVNTAGKEINIIRQAEYNDFKNNYFTANEYVLGRHGNGGIKIDGATTESFTVSFLAEPREMDLTTPVQPDLVGIHEVIVAEALRIAGYAVSDDQLKSIKL